MMLYNRADTLKSDSKGQNYTLQQHPLILNIPNKNKNAAKLTITIIQVILFEIWQSRNNYKHEHKLLPQQTIVEKINAQLHNILQVHYKKQNYKIHWIRSKNTSA